MILNKYRLYCDTCENYVETDYMENEPNVCPINNEHEIDVESFSIINTVDTTINDVHVIELSESQPFALPTYRTKGNATSVEIIPIGESKIIDYQLLADRYTCGGSLIGKNCEFGDYFVAQVYDKDGVIPEAYRTALCENYPVVAEYYEKRYLKINPEGITVHKIDTRPLVAKITAGLYLRIIYYATNTGNPREVVVNYDLLVKL